MCCFGHRACYIIQISHGGIMSDLKLKPFLVRLRPSTRALLDAAALQQRRSRASIIDQAVVDFVGDSLTDTGQRLDALLAKNARHNPEA